MSCIGIEWYNRLYLLRHMQKIEHPNCCCLPADSGNLALAHAHVMPHS